MAVIEANGWGEQRPAPFAPGLRVAAAALGRLRRAGALAVNPTVRGFVALFAFQVLLNVLVVAQERAAVMVAYGPSFVSNVLLAGVTYVAVRQLVAGRNAALGVGYALGGGVGGVLGLLATRTLGL